MRGLREKGAATVYAVVIMTVLALGAAVGMQVAVLVRHAHEAARAADLAALAATEAALQGGDGCTAARTVASRNGARVVRCTMRDEVASVTVRITAGVMWGDTVSFDRRARAAPAELVD